MSSNRKPIHQTPIYYMGVTRSLRDWCTVLNLEYSTVSMRYRRGAKAPAHLFRATPNKSPERSDIPANIANTRKIKHFKYPTFLELFPVRIASLFIRMSSHDKEAIMAIFQPVLMDIIINKLPEEFGIDLHGKNQFYEGVPTVLTHSILKLLPKKQADVLRKHFEGRHDEFHDVLSKALPNILPKVMEVVTGVPENGAHGPTEVIDKWTPDKYKEEPPVDLGDEVE